MPQHQQIAAKLDEIEEEMKRIGFWQNEPLRKEQLDFHQAFAMDTMAFSQWLQFIFIPRVRQIIESEGEFPSSSQVGQQAFREWVAYGSGEDTDRIVTLLGEFDAMFG